MIKNALANYSTPTLLGLLIFSSNFLNTDLFNFGEQNFAVWFVLSVFCFASGWYINRTLGWHHGGKVIFAVIVSVTAVSMVLIMFFSDYFSANELILFSLRNITLGSMGIFGMAIQEILAGEKQALILTEKVKLLEASAGGAKKEAELVLREAYTKSDKIIFDATSNAKNTILKKERIESELKEFIQAEKELIKRYEEL